MNAMIISIAGYGVEIKSEYGFSSKMYTAFRSNSPVAISISLTDDDIDFSAVERYPKAYLRINTFQILCKLANSFLDLNVILMHGAVIGLNNSSYLFTAPSRTGKTTHILKWLERLPDAYVINGDKPFIKLLNDGTQPLACGSPWAGKENMYTNTNVPLKAIICMERAEENSIHVISFSEAFPILLQQTYRPDDEEKMRKTLRLLQQLNGYVKFYKFKCNNYQEDCFNVAYTALVREDY